MAHEQDRSLAALLDLHGLVLYVHEEGYQVRFKVVPTSPSVNKPHGLNYSLTLHAPNGERLVGFDNAHAVSGGTGPGSKKIRQYDHRHRLHLVQPYEYTDAASLLADFWFEVDAVLNERGLIP